MSYPPVFMIARDPKVLCATSARHPTACTLRRTSSKNFTRASIRPALRAQARSSVTRDFCFSSSSARFLVSNGALCSVLSTRAGMPLRPYGTARERGTSSPSLTFASKSAGAPQEVAFEKTICTTTANGNIVKTCGRPLMRALL